MRTTVIASIATLTLLALAPRAHAQTPRQVPTPAQAQASCIAEVKRAQNSPDLRLQGGTGEQVSNRAGAKVFLDQAADAAARGDERTCRDKLGAAQTLLSR